jgi:hypothetical protein
MIGKHKLIKNGKVMKISTTAQLRGFGSAPVSAFIGLQNVHDYYAFWNISKPVAGLNSLIEMERWARPSKAHCWNIFFVGDSFVSRRVLFVGDSYPPMP